MCVDRSVGEITESILPSMNMLSFAYDGSICLDVPYRFGTFGNHLKQQFRRKQRVELGSEPFHFVIQLLF
jgi:hypothetical protein